MKRRENKIWKCGKKSGKVKAGTVKNGKIRAWHNEMHVEIKNVLGFSKPEEFTKTPPKQKIGISPK